MRYDRYNDPLAVNPEHAELYDQLKLLRGQTKALKTIRDTPRLLRKRDPYQVNLAIQENDMLAKEIMAEIGPRLEVNNEK